MGASRPIIYFRIMGAVLPPSVHWLWACFMSGILLLATRGLQWETQRLPKRPEPQSVRDPLHLQQVPHGFIVNPPFTFICITRVANIM